jgi:FtsP/CotA-like multicopper oxidase with cupredoxin domain
MREPASLTLSQATPIEGQYAEVAGLFSEKSSANLGDSKMKGQHTMNRRTFLRYGSGLLGMGAATWLGGCTIGPVQGVPPAATGMATPSDMFTPDVELALRATASEVALLDGSPTRVWSYQGETLTGDSAALQPVPDSYLGPIIRTHAGQNIRTHFTNEIPDASIIHWHGLHVPAAMDGHPRTVIGQGETYVYEFPIRNRAGTYWYHPHPHGRTGPQVYQGLAGLFLISDEEEAALGLPTGEQDVPLVIQDRTFDNNNQFVYLPNGMPDRMLGFLGNRILVNGQPDYVLSVAAQPYRLRVLNGSNSRIYRLAWEDGTPLTVIGSDGGLLEKPAQRDYVTLAPAERVELWADFSGRPVGSELRLRSLPFDSTITGGMMGGNGGGMMGGNGGGMMGGNGGGMMGGNGGGMMGNRAALASGADFSVLTVRIDQPGHASATLPTTLSQPGFRRVEDAVNPQTPRTFTMSMGRMQWLLNGHTFEMENVAGNETVALNTVEVWEFFNQPGGMMSMAHPMHVHGLQFQVIERQPPTDATLKANWEQLQPGFVDEGWKDTILVMPGERVRILMAFADYAGLFLYHCHNLEHEDMGMMRNYLVQA